MAGEVTARTAEDVDQLVMTAAQIKAIASGNPLILEKVAAEVELTRLERLYSVWRGNRRRLQNQLELLPADLQHLARAIAGYQQAVAMRDQFSVGHDADEFRMILKKSIFTEEEITLTERQRAGAHLRQLTFALVRQAQSRGRLTHVIGSYRGFEIIASSAGRGVNALSSLFAETETALRLPGSESAYHFNLGESDLGIIQSLDAQLRGLDHKLEQALATQRELQHRQAQITTELGKGWEHATKYQELKAKLDALNSQLSHTGQEMEASPVLSVLDADALLPVPEIAKVHQVVSITAQEQSIEPTTASSVMVASGLMAEAKSEENDSLAVASVEEMALSLMEEDTDDLFSNLAVLNELHKEDDRKRKPSKRRAAANSQQMSFGWL